MSAFWDFLRPTFVCNQDFAPDSARGSLQRSHTTASLWGAR